MEQIAQFLDFAVEESRDARAVAERVASILSSPGCKRIALSGGSTPPRIFRELADLGIGWNGAWVCPTDERQVDPHQVDRRRTTTATENGYGCTRSDSDTICRATGSIA